MGAQNYFLASGAATLTARLRKLSFGAVMGQDSKLGTNQRFNSTDDIRPVEFFDDEKNTVRSLYVVTCRMSR